MTSEINTGGLFRCCIQTILDDPEPDTVGRSVECSYCGAPLIVAPGPVWQWDREAALTTDQIAKTIRAGLEHEERD